jgi:hypothetical protein
MPEWRPLIGVVFICFMASIVLVVVHCKLISVKDWLIDWCLTPPRRVSLVEQELLTLPEHMNSAPAFSEVRVTRPLVSYELNEFFYRQLEFICRMGTNCAPLLTDLFLYSHKADSMQGLLKKQAKIARSFNFMLVMSYNEKWVDVWWWSVILHIHNRCILTLLAVRHKIATFLNDHGYGPLVNTSRFFPHSWLICIYPLTFPVYSIYRRVWR